VEHTENINLSVLVEKVSDSIVPVKENTYVAL